MITRRIFFGLIFLGLVNLIGLNCATVTEVPFERTEIREPCDNYDPLRQPFFGDTHIHTSFSFDAYAFAVRNDPYDAYEFAKGAPLPLPAAVSAAGEPQTRTAQLSRPLDFTAVTDHSELLGELQICTRSPEDTPGFDAELCKLMRAGTPNPTAIATLWAANPILKDFTSEPLPFCLEEGVDCEGAAISMWQDIQDAAEAHYDRSSDCSFTTFVAYEYTAQPSFNNLHRNVIFRNKNVVETPISNIQTGGPYPPVLWQMLQEKCLDAGTGCDVLTISHNANLSGSTDTAPEGRMFRDPADTAEAEARAFFEPLTEMMQHKGNSECRYDQLTMMGVQTVDEFCSFEQLPTDILNPAGPDVIIEGFPPRNMIRNALKEGMALASRFGGVNPFKLGIIGGTDDHNGTPGSAEEKTFQGHVGNSDAPLARMIQGIYVGPGSLAVVWAEENSRDAIFAAMRRKETYATSGTRPILRFFGGWVFDTRPGKLCSDPNRVAQGYGGGVPMGSDLPPLQEGQNPRFLVAAMKDPGTEGNPGTPLQRIQIVKGWVDSEGNTHETVLNAVGNTSLSGNELNTDTCETNQSAGFNELCTVWEDTDFDPNLPAFYYARLLENPSCRWSTYACKEADVDPFLGPAQCQAKATAANDKAVMEGVISPGDEPFNNCCLNETNDPFLARTIQERAWSSPIWYVPGS